jgi:hypothetical protein
MQFKLGRAWFLAVYREGKKTQKMSRKKQGKIRGKNPSRLVLFRGVSGVLVKIGGDLGQRRMVTDLLSSPLGH